MEKIISCSILNVDFLKLNEILKELHENKIPWLHFDVMDGNFVKNLSFGSSILKSINDSEYKFFNDVHLMINDPLQYYLDFIEAGASMITFHIESYNFDFEKNLKLINLIKSHNVKVGISLKPKTNISEVFKYLKYVDLVLIMSVEPGFGGQKFIEETYQKIKELKSEINKENLNVLISVDGGINDTNAKKVREYGVDILVSGSYLLADIKDRKNKL